MRSGNPISLIFSAVKIAVLLGEEILFEKKHRRCNGARDYLQKKRPRKRSLLNISL